MKEKFLYWARKKWIFYLLAISPLFFLALKIVRGDLGANPLESILLYFGNSATTLLLIVLWISPLDKILPSKIPIRVLNIHKRLLGVSAFFYALVHFFFYLLDQATLQVFLENFQRRFVIIGMSALSILLVLAVTSFDFMVKKMGKKNWKRLHRLVYLAVFLLFFHITSKNKGNYEKALLLLAPLLFAELIRLYLFLKKRVAR
jgi:sulfoxide reductase heme-binding subunit YedZ